MIHTNHSICNAICCHILLILIRCQVSKELLVRDGIKMFLTDAFSIQYHWNSKENCVQNSYMDPLTIVLTSCYFILSWWVERQEVWIGNRKKSRARENMGASEKRVRVEEGGVRTWGQRLLGCFSTAHVARTSTMYISVNPVFQRAQLASNVVAIKLCLVLTFCQAHF